MHTRDIVDQLGTALGGAYTIERELGGGGMSRVFVARDLALGRPVVIKVLHPDLAAGVSVDRFRREIQVVATLQHPCVVPLYGAGELDELPYYTMPFVEGESLRARLGARGLLAVPEAVRILRDLASALTYAHERGVVHRDIKPDNILLTGGYAVVTDFGIAKAVTASRTNTDAALTLTGTSLGTPAYMAPEQVAGDPATDHRADIYAFGCVAYELLTGRPPFRGRAPHQILAAHISERPEPIADLRAEVPPALATLVMRCLAKDPQERPQRATELTAVLDAVGTPTGGSQNALPAIALATRRKLARALAIYSAAFLAVTLLTRAAIIVLGLPDWVLPGALIVMALGLPAIVFTALTYHGAHVARTVATRTPGGSPSSIMLRLAARLRPYMSWRRTWVGGGAAIGAFVLFVAAFMALRAMGIGPAASLFAAGKLQDHDRLLVTDFGVRGADASIGGAITEAVRADLAQSPAISILSPGDVASALARMQRPASTRVDLALARDIATREGVKGIVDGDVVPLGTGFLLSLRLVSTDSGAELASFRETADNPKELIPTLSRLTRELRSRIGESLRTVRATPPLEHVTTSSLDALQKYAAGARANDIDGNYPRAITLLREAVALDTGFAMGWRKLAVAMANVGLPSDSVAAAATKAFRYRDRLTPRERDLAIARYYSDAMPDRQKAVAAYEDALRLDSTDEIAANNLGLLLINRREFARAESLFASTFVSGRGGVQEHENIVLSQIAQGRLADAERSLAVVSHRYPNAPDRFLAQVPLYYARDRGDSLSAILIRARALAEPQAAATATGALSDLELLRGRLRASAALRAQATALDSARGAPHPALQSALETPTLDIAFRNRPAEGVRALDSALARHPFARTFVLDRAYFRVAKLYALAHRPDRARAVLAQYAADVRDTALRRWFEPAQHSALGELALAEGRPLDAVREFRNGDVRPDGPASSCTACLPAELARAFDQAHMSDSAITWYERYLGSAKGLRLSREDFGTPSAESGAPDPMNLARVYERLGELYAAAGDRSRAAMYDGKFIELWKGADPELQPQVAEARRRLAQPRIASARR